MQDSSNFENLANVTEAFCYPCLLWGGERCAFKRSKFSTERQRGAPPVWALRSLLLCDALRQSVLFLPPEVRE